MIQITNQFTSPQKHAFQIIVSLIVFHLLSGTLAVADPQTRDSESLGRMLHEQQLLIERQQKQIDALAEQFSNNSAPSLEWEGYGVINYAQYDFFRNAQDDTPDRRARMDVERFVLELKHAFSDSAKLEAEIEFEHGGTGSAIEYEPEEFGEYELEVEKGGEIKLEKLQLEIEYSKGLGIRFGHIIVPFGMVNTHHRPGDYFTTQRSLAETSLIPAAWDENGLEIFGRLGNFEYNALVVNGLDSSGFSGYAWIAGGHQGNLEFVNADNLAFIGRLNYHPNSGFMLGTAVYTGDSADNRPRQNLNTSAVVTIYEIHARLETARWKTRLQWLAGTVENSDAVTQANLQTSNAALLDISRTGIGHKAESFFFETGYDIGPWLSLATPLYSFIRYDDFNTMAETEGNVTQLARYDRQAVTTGFNYTITPGVILKAEYSKLEHQGDIGNESSLAAIGIGFEFE